MVAEGGERIVRPETARSAREAADAVKALRAKGWAGPGRVFADYTPPREQPETAREHRRFIVTGKIGTGEVERPDAVGIARRTAEAALPLRPDGRLGTTFYTADGSWRTAHPSWKRALRADDNIRGTPSAGAFYAGSQSARGPRDVAANAPRAEAIGVSAANAAAGRVAAVLAAAASTGRR